MQYFIYLTGWSILSFFSSFNSTPETVIQPTETATELVNMPPECAGDNANLRIFYWNNLSGTSLSTLYNHLYYPQVPDGMIFTKDLEIPAYFNDSYGALVRGYILAPESGDYYFNITGDDQTAFHLSTDDTPENVSLLVNTPDATGGNHDEHEEQTDTVALIAGSYYYFELNLKEGGGGDFAQVHWQLPSQTNEEWGLIGRTHLYDYTCETLCNPTGTPCDDGDNNTFDDAEDGFCNCYGRPEGGGTCVGDKGSITALYYDDLPGNDIIHMDTAAIFPDNPTRAEVLKDFRGPSVYANNYGTYVRTYLTIPVTGEYTFNITGDDETRLWLSSGESTDPEDLTAIAHISGWTSDGEHDKYESQTSAPITLTKGQYYYMELKMKEGGGGDHYTVWWQTPFATDTNWKVINGAFLFQYACETACVPDDVPCDDHDASTINDSYQDCECVGTPCGLPDCSDSPTYVAYEVCNLTNKHSNEVDSWQSCEMTPNPNASRGTGHWIMYDLNDMYQIHDTHIWNYNKANETGKGIKDVVIDVSFDGISWGELGTYTWPQAPGTIEYEGFVGQDYNGQAARYVLITALNNWNDDNCSGFSELKMNIEECPNINTPCDDGNPNTFDDAYNEFCACVGTSDGTLALDLLSFGAKWDKRNVLVEWQVQNEEVGTLYEVQRSLDAENFEAIGIISGKATSPRKTAYQLVDGRGYQLANELFYRLKMIEDAGRERFSHVVSLSQTDGAARLKIDAIQPNPFQESVQIQLTVPNDSDKIQLRIFNGQGQFVKDLVNGQVNEGQYQIAWDGTDSSGKSVQSGIYYLQLTDGKQRIGRRVIKL